MSSATQTTREQTILRIGAVLAIIGTVLNIAGGTGYGQRPSSSDPEAVLRWVADRPDWYWQGVYLVFVLGALMWVGAYAALATSLAHGASWGLGRLGVASIIVGATLHAVDAAISGVGLSALAGAWEDAPAEEQASILRDGETLLGVLDGTWASVIMYFHGWPFILFGLAVVFSRRYPAWIGWIGFIGGLGSVILGAMMFLDVGPEDLFVAFALVVSVFTIVMGVLMWQQADQRTSVSPQPTHPGEPIRGD